MRKIAFIAVFLISASVSADAPTGSGGGSPDQPGVAFQCAGVGQQTRAVNFSACTNTNGVLAVTVGGGGGGGVTSVSCGASLTCTPNPIVATGTVNVVGLGGDLAGTVGNATVGFIQNHPVSNALPTSGQLMVWDPTGSQWSPEYNIFPTSSIIFADIASPVGADVFDITNHAINIPYLSVSAQGVAVNAVDSHNNQARTTLKIGHELTAGTPAIGIGSIVLYELPDSAGNDQDSAKITVTLTDVTPNAVSSQMMLSTVNAGGAGTSLTLPPTGSAQFTTGVIAPLFNGSGASLTHINASWTSYALGTAVVGNNFLGPFNATQAGNFTEIGCNWAVAGSGGTGTAATIQVFNNIAATELCSCSIGSCQTGALTPISCSCNTAFPAAAYTVRLKADGDCVTPPAGIVCNVTVTP